MKIKGLLAWFCCIVLLLCMLPVGAIATSEPPSQAGARVLEGGQRDFLWPVPGRYNLTSCYLDNRNHYSLDIDGETGDAVVASYAGTVTGVDTADQTTGWGNFVLLEHRYTLKSGSQVTMYSRYAHLEEVLVSVGDTVTAGQTVGTVGNTGTSTGSHLDYDIMYGSTSGSLDPYINELLALPSGLYTTGGWCCQQYVAYVKEFYSGAPACTHAQYDAQGNCTECGKAYDWKATEDFSVLGNYTVSGQTTAYATPYTAVSGGTALSVGQSVVVNGKVTNAQGQGWYEISLSGGTAYVLVSALKFESYVESQIVGKLTTLTEGQVLKPWPHRLDGTITSRYPLRRITGYLDGKWYGSWSSQGNVRELNLGDTDLNNNLSFSKMAPGQHTLRIVVVDSSNWEEVEVILCTFTIESDGTGGGTTETVTVTYMMEPENQVITMVVGQTLGTLPLLSKDGADFLGWFTQPEGGQQVTETTVPTEDMTLYPQWETVFHTVLIEGTELSILHGEYILEFPEVSKEGYDFVGWFTPDGQQVTDTTPITEDMVLHPKWEGEKTWLILDAGEGSVTPSQVPVVFGEPYGQLPVPEREGYVFQGWRLRGQIITDDTIVEVEGDHTAVAIWGEESSNNAGTVIAIILVIVMVLAAAAIGVMHWLRHRYDDEEWM